jgi:tRNA-intron endonuclease, archaea type
LNLHIEWSKRRALTILEEAGPAEAQLKPVEGTLAGDNVVVRDKGRMGELEESGYGTRGEGGLVLRDYEALYLLYAKKLELSNEGGKAVGFERLAELHQRKASDSWTKFIIYRDLRTRGYVVREGFGFGTDLRVYERGDYPQKPAKYVVFALDEGIEKRLSELQKSVREMARMGKEAIIAVIERRGEVIYYRVSRARF